jgi:hypothetical protein
MRTQRSKLPVPLAGTMKKAEPPIFRNQLLAHLRIEILHFPKLTIIRDASRRYVATAFEAAYLEGVVAWIAASLPLGRAKDFNVLWRPLRPRAEFLGVASLKFLAREVVGDCNLAESCNPRGPAAGRRREVSLLRPGTHLRPQQRARDAARRASREKSLYKQPDRKPSTQHRST